MRHLPLFLALGCLLASCSASPVVYNPAEPVPTALVEGVVNAKGEGDVRVDSPIGPLAQLFRWEGDVTLRVRSQMPYLVVEENFDSEEGAEVEEVIVEPTEGNEEAALDALNRGLVEIRRKNGDRTLNARGSIEARRARRFPPASPETPKPPEPVSGIVPLHDCPNGCSELPPPCFPALWSIKEIPACPVR